MQKKSTSIALCFCLTFFTSVFGFLSCEKDPEIIVETVTVTDTLVVTQTDTVFVTLSDTVTLTEFVQDTATTFFLVRHAETTGIGNDPNLSTAGLERADELVRLLKNTALDAVYSTNFNRTMQSATPTSTDQGLSIQTYGGFDLDVVSDEILANYPTGKILVVGHSNTTPSFINELIGSNDYANLPEMQYDNFFIVNVYEKGNAEVLHLKYGVPTP